MDQFLYVFPLALDATLLFLPHMREIILYPFSFDSFRMLSFHYPPTHFKFMFSGFLSEMVDFVKTLGNTLIST